MLSLAMDINEKISSYPGVNRSTGGSSGFPGAGLRVLVVDDDKTCLFVTGMKLKTSQYEVKAVPRGKDALEVLRATKGGFDLVLTDIHMPEMDGFELMYHIHQEFDVPVIMMTGDTSKEIASQGIQRGASLFLTKPVSLHDVRIIWQHARKNKMNPMNERTSFIQIPPQDVAMEEVKNSGSSPSEHEVNSRVRTCSRRKEDKEKRRSKQLRPRKNEAAKPKKKRVVWNDRLHNLFLEAIERIGFDNVVPKKIFDYMKVPGLTRENIASHLQKFRNFLKKYKDDEEVKNITTSLAYEAFVTSGAASEYPSSLVNVQQALPRFCGYNATQVQSGEGLQQRYRNDFGLEYSSEYVRRHMMIKRSKSGRGVMKMVHEQNLARQRMFFARGPIDNRNMVNVNSGLDNMRPSFFPQYPMISSSGPTNQLLPPMFGNLAIPEQPTMRAPPVQNGGYQFVQQPRFSTLESPLVQNDGYQFVHETSFQTSMSPAVQEYAPPLQNGGYESVQNPSFQPPSAPAVLEYAPTMQNGGYELLPNPSFQTPLVPSEQSYSPPMQNGGYESVQNPSFQTPVAPLVQEYVAPIQNGGYESVQNPISQTPLTPLVQEYAPPMQNGGYQVVQETSIPTPVLTPPPPAEAAPQEQDEWNDLDGLFDLENLSPIVSLNSNELLFNEEDFSNSFFETLADIGDKNGYGEFDMDFDVSDFMQANDDNMQM